MKRVIRLVSAVSAGASLAWGIAKALRKGRKSGPPSWESTPSPAPPQPKAPVEPAPAEPQPEPAQEASVEPSAPVAEPEPAAPVEEAVAPSSELVMKGVVVYHPQRLVDFVNDADEDTLRSAGI